MYRSCARCGGRFETRYWSQHERSNRHKQSLFNAAQTNLHPRNGRMIRSTTNLRCYDILYPSIEIYQQEVCRFQGESKEVSASTASTSSSSSTGERRSLRPVPALIPLRNRVQTAGSSRGESQHLVADHIPLSEGFTSTRNFVNTKDRLSHLSNLYQICEYFNFFKEGIRYRLEEGLRLHEALKINLALNIILEKKGSDGGGCVTYWCSTTSRGGRNLSNK